MTDIYFSIPSLGSHHFGRNDFRKNFKWIDNVEFLRWHCIWQHHLNFCDQNAYNLSRNRRSNIPMFFLDKGDLKDLYDNEKNIFGKTKFTLQQINCLARITILAQNFTLFRSSKT